MTNLCLCGLPLPCKAHANTCVCNDPYNFCGGVLATHEEGYCHACASLGSEAHCLHCPFECCINIVTEVKRKRFIIGIDGDISTNQIFNLIHANYPNRRVTIGIEDDNALQSRAKKVEEMLRRHVLDWGKCCHPTDCVCSDAEARKFLKMNSYD